MTLDELRKLVGAATPGEMHQMYLFGSRNLPVSLNIGDKSLEFSEASTLPISDVDVIEVLWNLKEKLIAMAEAADRFSHSLVGLTRLHERLRLAEAVCRAAEPLVDEWRSMPKFADDIWQKRQDVVLTFAAWRASQPAEGREETP